MSLGDQSYHQHIQRSTYPFDNIGIIKKGWGVSKLNLSEFHTEEVCSLLMLSHDFFCVCVSSITSFVNGRRPLDTWRSELHNQQSFLCKLSEIVINMYTHLVGGKIGEYASKSLNDNLMFTFSQSTA